MPNYQIPEAISKIAKNTVYQHNCLMPESKLIFLEPTDEKFFLNFPKAWEKTLQSNFAKVYEDGKNMYFFSISTYDGEKISSYSLKMLGLEFKDYLTGILRFSKTISLSITSGINSTNYLICRS